MADERMSGAWEDRSGETLGQAFERAKHERDEAIAAVARVEALVDAWGGQSELAMLSLPAIAANLRAALEPCICGDTYGPQDCPVHDDGPEPEGDL